MTLGKGGVTVYRVFLKCILIPQQYARDTSDVSVVNEDSVRWLGFGGNRLPSLSSTVEFTIKKRLNT